MRINDHYGVVKLEHILKVLILERATLFTQSNEKVVAELSLPPVSPIRKHFVRVFEVAFNHLKLRRPYILVWGN